MSSDSSFPVFFRWGTQADRLAFTPTPPTIGAVTVPVLYQWFETDNPPDFYLYIADGVIDDWVGPYQAGITSGIDELTGDVTAGPGSGSVVATIANAAVTLAKIANASANSKVLGSGDAGSGNPYSELSLGSNLSMSGTTINAAGPGSASGLVLLDTQVASGSATLDFDVSSIYDDYIFVFDNVIPASAGQDFWMRVSIDGGATFETTNYLYAYSFVGTPSGFSSTGGSGSTGQIVIAFTVSTNANYGIVGELRVHSVNQALYTRSYFQGSELNNGDGNMYYVNGNGVWAVTTVVNAIRFMFASGNITSGTIRQYGLVK